jgi:hypothetical protein
MVTFSKECNEHTTTNNDIYDIPLGIFIMPFVVILIWTWAYSWVKSPNNAIKSAFYIFITFLQGEHLLLVVVLTIMTFIVKVALVCTKVPTTLPYFIRQSLNVMRIVNFEWELGGQDMQYIDNYFIRAIFPLLFLAWFGIFYVSTSIQVSLFYL